MVFDFPFNYWHRFYQQRTLKAPQKMKIQLWKSLLLNSPFTDTLLQLFLFPIQPLGDTTGLKSNLLHIAVHLNVSILFASLQYFSTVFKVGMSTHDYMSLSFTVDIA